MRELIAKLKEIQRQGYETITIAQVLQFIREIQINRKIRKIERQ